MKGAVKVLRKQEKNNMQQIVTDSGVKSRIKRMLGYSYPTIRAALRGESKTVVAMKIRKLAIELGGVEKPGKTN